MMKPFGRVVVVAGIMAFLLSGVSFAQTNDPVVQKRMGIQEQRIDQGIESGQLTPREAGRLEANQARIKQMEQRMKSDGQLTGRERNRLQNMLDNSGARIFRQKHDRQRVGVK
jgi:hypothetical protein